VGMRGVHNGGYTPVGMRGVHNVDSSTPVGMRGVHNVDGTHPWVWEVCATLIVLSPLVYSQGGYSSSRWFIPR